MGGSGGDYFRVDPKQLREQIKNSENNTERQEYEATVAEFLSSELVDYNDRDVQLINKYLEEIIAVLSGDIEGSIDLKFGGSVSKHTYVDGLSDIDSLVFIDNCELAQSAPNKAKDFLANKLKRHFKSDNVTVGNLAVTISFGEIQIQLLPAISCNNSNVKISSPDGKTWSMIKPKEFSELLTKVNSQNGNKVIPTIKLVKSLISQLPEKHKITGYHSESLAVEIFKSYKGTMKPKEMIQYYFKEAATRILEPIKDKTGQSIHVDEYLGDSNSLPRKVISDAFNRIYRRINNADNLHSSDEWRRLFGKF